MPDVATQFWMNWWIQLAVGIGTIGAVLVALFAQGFRAKFFPPQLSLNIHDPEGEREIARLVSQEHPEGRAENARYYRLRVTNRRRWSPANQVQVVLLKVEMPGADMRFSATWVGDLPLAWTHQELFPTLRTIGPDAHVDLCSVIKDKWLSLHPLIVPHNFTVLYRQPVRLILSVQVKSNECDSSILRLLVAWDGQWHDGATEMRRHLTVSVQE
jgi:hypothetical protein